MADETTLLLFVGGPFDGERREVRPSEIKDHYFRMKYSSPKPIIATDGKPDAVGLQGDPALYRAERVHYGAKVVGTVMVHDQMSIEAAIKALIDHYHPA